jgi:hypothetical protein
MSHGTAKSSVYGITTAEIFYCLSPLVKAMDFSPRLSVSTNVCSLHTVMVKLLEKGCCLEPRTDEAHAGEVRGALAHL